ncbi:MAG TPA: hypothetical protein VIB11_17450 [Pedococcus sp.]|jgi:hypothetical protein|uniref:hypothetical protein n=1 Tax=Pedococcus sp. TaxID=2860345 RepID=UPI002F95AADF
MTHRHKGRWPWRALTVAAVALALAGTGCTADPDEVAGGRSATPLPSSDAGTPTGTGSPSSSSTGGSTGSPTGTATSTPAALGAKWDWGRYAEFEPFLRTMSGGRTYYEVTWCDVEESQGARDWGTLDRIVERSRTVGVTMMLKLRVGRCWATGGDAQYERGRKTESAMPLDMAAYRGWVRDAVTRYSGRGVHEYAIENEINSKSFWAGTPQEFATLAATAAREIRAADRNARVVDAGLSSTTYGYGLSRWLLDQGREADAIAAYNRYYQRRFGTRGDKIVEIRDRAGLERALTSEQGARNLTYLALMSDLARRKVVDVRQIHFYETYGSVPALFSYLRATTPTSTPIEAWEVGRFDRSGDSESVERDEEMLKTMSMVLAEGAAVAIWLPLAFDPQGRNSDEPRYGLLEPDGRVRESGRLFQAMLDASRGARAVKVDDAGLTGVAFEKPGSTTAFVWADDTATIELGAGETASAVGKTAEGRSGRVTVDGQPVQLTLKSPVKSFLEAQ